MKKKIILLLVVSFLFVGCQQKPVTANMKDLLNANPVKVATEDQKANYLCDLISNLELEKLTGMTFKTGRSGRLTIAGENHDYCVFDTQNYGEIKISLDPRKFDDIKSFFADRVADGTVVVKNDVGVGDESFLITHKSASAVTGITALPDLYFLDNGKSLQLSATFMAGKESLDEGKWLEIGKFILQKK